ncbi:DNA-3-methyladenine glycosylase [bacterium]|nr:DNA-3-methyladenine glycosylase [bacterium]
MESSSANWSKKSWADLLKKSVPEDFYSRETLQVAKDLLGKLVVVRTKPTQNWGDARAGVTVSRIVETEAYRADDPASHSCRGETPRSAIMFGDPGKAYIYFIYGMYEMLNFVTEPRGYAGAVLIRAVEPVYGETLMTKRRQSSATKTSRTGLTNGPGRLTQALGIKMAHKGESLWGPTFYVIDDGIRPNAMDSSPRVGIRVATDKYWRFFVPGNPYVSKCRENSLSKPV